MILFTSVVNTTYHVYAKRNTTNYSIGVCLPNRPCFPTCERGENWEFGLRGHFYSP